jgi:hypothetical protein
VYAWVGLVNVDVEPSPKYQVLLAEPGVVLVKATVVFVQVEVALCVKLAANDPILTNAIFVMVSTQPELPVAIRRTVYEPAAA